MIPPPLARYGVFGVSNRVRYPLPPFLSVSPLESMRSAGAIPPPLKRGISAILAQYPMKTRQNACDTPLCDTISKRYCAIWGGTSHWAAKYGAQNDYTHFYCLGINSPIAQDICYTGLSGRNSSV